MRSRLDRKSGTQNEWMTSGDEPSRTVRPTGQDHLGRLAGHAGDGDVLVAVVELPLPLEADHVDRDGRVVVSASTSFCVRHEKPNSTATMTTGTTV